MIKVIARETLTASVTFRSVALPGCLSWVHGHNQGCFSPSTHHGMFLSEDGGSRKREHSQLLQCVGNDIRSLTRQTFLVRVIFLLQNQWYIPLMLLSRCFANKCFNQEQGFINSGTEKSINKLKIGQNISSCSLKLSFKLMATTERVNVRTTPRWE